MRPTPLLLLACLAAGASETRELAADAPAEAPPAARQAVAKAIEAVRKQHDAYEAALRAQCEKLVKDLEAQQAALTRKGDAGSASAVRALIERVGEGLVRDEVEAEVDALGARVAKRREQEVELVVSGDDEVECYLNGVRVGAATYTQFGTATVRVASGDVLACKATNFSGAGGLSLVLLDQRRQPVLSTGTPAGWAVYEPRDPAHWWAVTRREAAEARPAVAVENAWVVDQVRRGAGMAIAPLWGPSQPGTWHFVAIVP